MKTKVTINNETFENVSFTILPSGYGHNKVTAHFFHDGKMISHSKVTNNTMMTDAMRDEDDTERYEEARKDAAEWLISDYLDSL